MPGFTSRTADMNGYNDFERGHQRTSSYQQNGGIDPYRRDEFYREEPYNDYSRQVRPNGYGNDIDQGSLDGMRDEPTFEVDHLATYSSKTGVMHAEDGLRKLRQMENTTGIWTMRCLLIVERKNLIVIDKGNGEELERFPIQLVHEPTAIFKDDRREIYTNLILFTILDDPRKRNSQSDMHIFQSIVVPAQELVDEILAAKEGRGKVFPGQRIPPPPNHSAPEPPRPYDDMRMRQTGGAQSGFRASHIQTGDLDAGQNEALEKDVQLLNCCFDDIEKFVSRLQQAAEAFRELEKRKRERSANKKKNKQSGDGMLQMRARPPPAEDFVDIFQKFKFAFNLLSKLKAHIHDPNAPELVHFLFTPLSLIYEASRDPVHNNADLAERALAPLITSDAKQLLLNCLTSKELELWQQLGKSWTTSREEYRGYVDPYTPRFYNGWTPSPLNDDSRSGIENAVSNHMRQIDSRNRDELARSQAANMVLPFPSQNDDRFPREREDFRDYHQRSTKPPSTPPPPLGAVPNPNVTRYQEHVERHIDRNKHAHDDYPPPPQQQQPRNRNEENYLFALELKRMGATTYEAIHERQGKNNKELTVEKGDVVQVLDSSRNWWKLKNCKGDMGYAPYTILKEYQSRDDDRFDMDRTDHRGVRNSGDYNSYIPDHHHQSNVPAPPPVPPGGIKQGKKDDEFEDRKYYDRYDQDYRNGRREERNENHRGEGREDFQYRKERFGSSSSPSPHDNSFDKWSDRSNRSVDRDDRHADMRERREEPRHKNPTPPPPPAIKTTQIRKPQPEKSSSKPHHTDLHNELVRKVNSQQNISRVKQGVTVYLSRNSPPDEVKDWLDTKGFSERCISILDGYTGEELFVMQRKEMDRLLGKDEAHRLESQLLVQKNISGYGTRGASELRAVLQERKKKTEFSGMDKDNMGKPPSFTPNTPPDYSDSGSDIIQEITDLNNVLDYYDS